MLYIGHFSFDGRKGKDQDRHGYFTCIVDASDPDAAASSFAGQITRLQRTEGPFAQMARVYLEDIIQVRQLPSEPVVTLVQTFEGVFPPSVSHSLFGVETEGFEAFGLPSNVDREESGNAGDGFIYPDAFITFEDKLEPPPKTDT
jgi:hypothetical protein